MACDLASLAVAAPCRRCRMTIPWTKRPSHEGRPLPSPPAIRQSAARKIGVLLVNLGTPDGTDFWPMWRYLREFLSDPRVIELPQGDLVSDPLRAGADHPAAEIRRQLRQDLEPREGRIALCGPLRAGRPRSLLQLSPTCRTSSSTGACATAIHRSRAWSSGMEDQGCDRILTVPLYPQYSATTTATANDQLFRALMKMRRAPAVRVCAALLRRSGLYRRACASVQKHLATLDFEPEVVIASYPRHSETLFRAAAIPITAIARRRRGCCAKSLAGTSRS